MGNKNKTLEEINQQFNDQIDSSDHGFSLTKVFRENGLTNSFTKAALLFSLSVGAFGNIANAHTTNIVNSHQAESVLTIQHDHESGIEINELTTLTPEILETVAQNDLSGIWLLEETGEPIIITNSGNLSNPTNANMDKLTEFLSSHDIELNQENINPVAYNLFGSDVKVVNLNKDFFKEQNFMNEANYPMLSQYQNEFTAHHEYNHIHKTQLNGLDQASENGRSVFTGTLHKELNSDVYAYSMLVQTKNLNHSEGMELLDELVSFRENGFVNNLDLAHSTHFGLSALKETLSSNKGLYSSLKNAKENQVSEFSADFALKTFEQLDGHTDNVNKITRSDMAQDLEVFIQNGRTLDNFDSVVYNKLADTNSINGEDVFENMNYDSLLEEMADKIDKNEGMTFEKAANSIRGAKRLERGLSQIKLLDSFNSFKDQNELNNILENYAETMSGQSLSDLQAEHQLANNIKIEATDKKERIALNHNIEDDLSKEINETVTPKERKEQNNMNRNML